MGNILSKYDNNNCFEKYTEIRNELQTGDILLYRGTSLLSKSIQYFDNAYFNHTGIVWKVGERYFTLDMWSNGYQMVFMLLWVLIIQVTDLLK